jgi:hypothetical protein
MVTDFTVCGQGSFPVDMLRYDECYPVDGVSAANINQGTELRNVKLRTQRSTGYTGDRWASFGWVVPNEYDGE